MLLSIKNLSKTYTNGVQALKDVSLNIPTGMFGLLGPNGAGKSTLMRTIATLQEPDAGTIHLFGEQRIEVIREKNEVRKILGYLPQEFGVYPKISAEALLDHFAVLKGISNRKERKEIVEALLVQTNLYENRQKNLGTFSGGMKQRFGIAQALLGNPKLIIVDEPTAGLDPAERNRFLNLLAEIGENRIVILSTHIVEDVSNLCSQMAIIAKGEVLLTCEPIKAIEELNGKIWQKTIAKNEMKDYRNNFTVISSTLFAGETIIHVFSENQPDASFEQVVPDLEDVYFSTLLKAA
ncbi:ABC transporter ATP-binding protein [bacterium]|nr:ABC transporter ATP-binding protein [bacterium]